MRSEAAGTCDTCCGGFDNLRAHHAALLAFSLACEGEADEARQVLQRCTPAGTAVDHETLARIRATQALLVFDGADAARLAREAVAAAEQTDDLNLQATMRLALARAAGDPEEAAAARRLFDAKENLAAGTAAGLWSLQTCPTEV